MSRLPERIDTIESNLWYDPFSGDEALFDGQALFDEISKNYAENRIKHDDALDIFVEQTETVILTAQFQERFNDMAYIAAQMHALCGEDHGLRAALSQSALGSSLVEHGPGDGHDYTHQAHAAHDEDDIDPKTGKKKKNKKYGWLAALLD